MSRMSGGRTSVAFGSKSFCSLSALRRAREEKKDLVGEGERGRGVLCILHLGRNWQTIGKHVQFGSSDHRL